MKKRFLVFLLTIIAVFTLTSCSKKFTVTFNSNGGTSIDPVEVKKGKTVTKPADPTKEGSEFDGWYLGDSKYNFSSAVKEDITLNAVWKVKTFTITFTTSGGSSVSPQTVEYGKTVTKPADPTRVGFDFKGWNKGDTSYDFSTPVKESFVLRAVWEEKSDVNYFTVTLDANGGTLPSGESNTIRVPEGGTIGTLPTPTREGYKFNYWTLNGTAFNTNTEIEENITLVASWTKDGGTTPGVYTPKWEPNQQTGGWKADQLEFKILVLPVEQFDPFNTNYTGTSQNIKQRHQRDVESKYGIMISYVNWDDSASWGPSRIKYIKDNQPSGWFANNDYYVVNIASSWIPTLVSAGCLAELAKIDQQGRVTEGIFTEIGYVETPTGSKNYVPGTYQQDTTNNQVASTSQRVYGYIQGSVRPDYFMYFNENLIAECGLENPAELWLKGEWTWTKFEQYVNELQTALSSKVSSDGSKYYALSVGYAEFIIGATAASGVKISTSRPSLGLTSPEVINKVTQIQSLRSTSAYEPRGVEDVATSFVQGRSAIVHGDLWFIDDASRFDPAQCTFSIGAVPYPTADGQGGTPITTFDSNEAILDANDNPLELVKDSGEYIKGLDLSNSSFLIPYTSTSCYSVLDTKNGKQKIDNKIIFAVMYDLYDGLGADPDVAEVEEDEAYRNWLLTKFNHEIYADVIMSVQGKTYFELLDLISMTAGGGSHFGPNGFWVLASKICSNSTISAATELNSIQPAYEQALRDMGYNI